MVDAARAAFHDLAGFPDLQALAVHWPAMRADLDELHAPLMDVDRVNKPHAAVVAEVGARVAAGEPFGWVKGWGGEAGGSNADWTQYGLLLGDRPIPFAKAPRTLALLAGLRGIKVAAFVRLAPGTLLPLHDHPEVASEGLLQAHVTLRAPAACGSCLLNVAGEVRQHVEGGLIVFDGSMPHWALNASAEDRTILYLEFQRAALERPRGVILPAIRPAETAGPMDMRDVGPSEVNPLASDMSRAIRGVVRDHGRRAAVAASFASLLAGATMLDELAGHETAADALRGHLATAEQRIAQRAAGARGDTLN